MAVGLLAKMRWCTKGRAHFGAEGTESKDQRFFADPRNDDFGVFNHPRCFSNFFPMIV